MRRKNLNQKGNMLALVAIGLCVLLLIAFFVFNYSDLLRKEKKVQSAIDSAALAAAVDMSRVVVDGPLGRISLADDSSAQSSYSSASAADPSHALPFPMKDDVRPIMSINTVKATLRLDAVIADQPSIKNSSLKYLIAQDLTWADSATNVLRQRIAGMINGSAKGYDKFGNEINLVQDCTNAGNGQLSNIVITAGTVNTTQATNMPTPMPKGVDAETAGDATYLPNKDYKVAGSATTVRFLPTNTEATLLDSKNFATVSNTDIPLAVKVEADQTVTSIAHDGSGNRSTGTLHATAYAQSRCGNRPGGGAYVMGSSGSLVVSFPNGIPAGNPTAPSTGGPPLNFSTLAGIMNASQLDAKGMSTYGNWNSQSTGAWTKVEGGSVPWQKQDGSSLTPKPYKGLSGHDSDDPSVALTFLVYDWLKTIGVRPSVSSVVSALTFDFKQEYFSSSNTTPRLFSGNPILDLARPAYAQAAESDVQLTPVLTMKADGFDDPRNLKKFKSAADAYNRQQARMWGYVPADDVLAKDTMVGAIASNGNVTTVNGSPPGDLNDLLDAIVDTDRYSIETFNNVQTVLEQLANQSKAAGVQEINNSNQKKTLDTNKEKLSALKLTGEQVKTGSSYASPLASALNGFVNQNKPLDKPALTQLLSNLSQSLGTLDDKTVQNNLDKLETFNTKSLNPQTTAAPISISGSSAPTAPVANIKSAAAGALQATNNLIKQLDKMTASITTDTAAQQKIVDTQQQSYDAQMSYYESGNHQRLSLQTIVRLVAARPYLLNAWNNAMYGTRVAVAMKNNLRALTGGGVTKLGPGHFKVMNIDFYPPTRGATMDELMNPKDTKGVPFTTFVNKPIVSSTGQVVGSLGSKNWCAGPEGSGAARKSALNFYRSAANPVIGKNPTHDDLLLPAYAQTSFGAKTYKLVFRVKGGADSPGSGQIQIQPMLNSPYSDVPCLQGQSHYQNVNALSMTAPNDPNTTVFWQVQARDQNTTAFADNTNLNSQPDPNSSVKYFTDVPSGALANGCSEKNLNQDCLPAVAAEWAIFCPSTEAPPPPKSPDPPKVPPGIQPPVPTGGCDSYIFSMRSGGSATNTGQIVTGVKDMGIVSRSYAGDWMQGNVTTSARQWQYTLTSINVVETNGGWMDLSMVSEIKTALSDTHSTLATTSAAINSGLANTYLVQTGQKSGVNPGYDFEIWPACSPMAGIQHI